ncbi:MAG: hypothetical protein IPI90_03090 [Saprospiraceae bacterium]|nr:hypothetical protein [Candidatus Vicinibacter affinis]
MKKLLIAFPVSDLTIARYLAAREIDFLALDLDSMNQLEANKLVNQLREWTEGPGIIGVTVDEEKKAVYEFLQIFDGLLLNCEPFNLNAGSIPKIEDGSKMSVHFLTNDSLLNRIEEKELPQTLVTVSNGQDSFPEKALGWIFNPGKEEHTGIYDFDQLEEFLDKLQDHN